MKRVLILFACAVTASLCLTACSMTGPVCATSNAVGTKVGEASGTGYFHILNFGVDASIRSAAKNGGITKISTVDFKMTDALGIIQTYTCIVTGE